MKKCAVSQPSPKVSARMNLRDDMAVKTGHIEMQYIKDLRHTNGREYRRGHPCWDYSRLRRCTIEIVHVMLSQWAVLAAVAAALQPLALPIFGTCVSNRLKYKVHVPVVGSKVDDWNSCTRQKFLQSPRVTPYKIARSLPYLTFPVTSGYHGHLGRTVGVAVGSAEGLVVGAKVGDGVGLPVG